MSLLWNWNGSRRTSVLRAVLCTTGKVLLANCFALGSAALLCAQTATSLTITSNGSPVTSVAAGTAVTLTAAVTAGSTRLTVGQVNFCDAAATYCEDLHLLGTAQLTSAGTATLVLRPTPGSHTYKAVFAGTKTYATSTSASSSLSVTGLPSTTTTLNWSGTVVNPTLTAAVIDTGTSQGPTGSVTFVDTSNNYAVLGRANLGATSSSLSVVTSATLAPAARTIIADFNGDGIPDMAAAGAGVVYVSLGNGDGTFFKTVTIPIAFLGNGWGFLAAGDFNDDGIPDLAVTYSGSVAILLGHGDGTFQSPSMIAMAGMNDAVEIVAADFNHDGILDLAVGGCQSNCGSTSATNPPNALVDILLGKGDGTFTVGAAGPTLQGSILDLGFVARDFNGDGIPDLAFMLSTQAASTGSEAVIWLSNGDGTFGNDVGFIAPYTAYQLAVADVNNDGIPDLALDVTYNNVGGSGMVFLYLGAGGGGFSQPTWPGASLNAVTFGDFNGDGILDLAGPQLNMLGNGTSYFTGGTFFFGKGNGAFPTQTTLSWPSSSFVAVGGFVSADFNGDGLSDLVYDSAPAALPGNENVSVGLMAPQQTTASMATTLSAGTHLIEAVYSGDGNFAASTSGLITINVESPAMTLSASPNTGLVAGQTTTLSATLSPYSTQTGTTNGETLSFYDGGNLLGTGALASGVATFTTGQLVAGTHNFTASFAGDSNFAPSTSASLPISVASVPATLAVSAYAGTSPTGSSTTATYGENVVVSAVLTCGSVNPFDQSGETITVTVGNTVLGTGTLVATDIHKPAAASVSLNTLPIGVDQITASYPGDNICGPATGSTTMTVTGNILTVTANNASRAYGLLNPAFTGTVSGAVNGDTFTVSGTATATTVSAPGVYPITPTVTGANLSAYMVVLVNGTLTVTKSTPAETLTASSSSISSGTPVTFTTRVPAAGSGVTPTGTVSFYEGATLLGTGMLSAGPPTYTTSTLTAGSHTITAAYSGDGNYAATSATATVTVTLAPPLVGLVTSSPVAYVTTPVTFTAVVPASGLGVAPTGSVSFYDGTTLLGSATLFTGAATYTTSSLSVGTHAITAVYAGDGNYSSATSTALSQVIIPVFSLGQGSGGNITVTAMPGGQAVYSLAVKPGSNGTFPYALSFAVTGLPAGATATFSPATIPAGAGPTNVTLTVTLPASATAAPMAKPFRSFSLPVTLALVLLPFAGWRRRGVARVLLSLIAATALATALTGCVGSGNLVTAPYPPQNYTLTITATSGTLAQSTTLTLTVE